LTATQERKREATLQKLFVEQMTSATPSADQTHLEMPG